MPRNCLSLLCITLELQVKNDLEAKVLCLTAIGLIKLNRGQLDAVKVVLQK